MRARPIAFAVVALAGAGALAWLLGPAGEAPRGPQAAQRAELTVPPLAGEVAAGATLFSRYCAQCHGAVGEGTDQGPPLIHRVYAPGHHGDPAFYFAALNGSRAHHWRFGDMPPVEGITEPEVTKIIAFIRAVQQANGVE